MSCYNSHRPCFVCGSLIDPINQRKALCPVCHGKTKDPDADWTPYPEPAMGEVYCDFDCETGGRLVYEYACEDDLPMFDPRAGRRI